MKYCTFHFDVIYKDGNNIQGFVPYRGDEISEKTLQSFIKSFFTGPKPVTEVIISDAIEFDDPQKWITTIRQWPNFEYLNSVNGFAGDLLMKYFPEERNNDN